MTGLFGLDDELPIWGKRATIRSELAAHGGRNMRLLDETVGFAKEERWVTVYRDLSTSYQFRIAAGDFDYLRNQGVLVGLAGQPPISF